MPLCLSSTRHAATRRHPRSAERCLLEWEGEGAPPLPLLKDLFASERRRAKVLNFSIAYGKTAHGLSKDWKVSVKEAEATVSRWYSDRPEVGGCQGREAGVWNDSRAGFTGGTWRPHHHCWSLLCCRS
jgi:hypothetical protein